MSDNFIASCYDVRIGTELFKVLEDAESARDDWRHIWFLRWRYPEVRARAKRGEDYVNEMEAMIESAWDSGHDIESFNIDSTGNLIADGRPF